MSSVTTWTGRLTDHIVWDSAADCSRLVVLQWQGPVSKRAARPTDNECSSVSRMQLSDISVGDERTNVGQVTRGVAGQGPTDENCNVKHDALLHTGCLQLWKTWKTWKSQEFVNSGKFREFTIYSGNLSDVVDCYMIVSLGHQVVCIIVSNSSVNWLSDTATGMDGASHHAPSIKYSVILQESCRTDC